ncbi:YceI family protein [Cupriavidus basilensis]|uniref:YceI family protein n=1 Tax=Cupriavidus basilensis TaxID=68895 RepID=UPI0023E824CC|nr:YceI family protein [Cupriavidus basilensis]MDF3886396.1 YceI family protein [Cupriavidus basilensis]
MRYLTAVLRALCLLAPALPGTARAEPVSYAVDPTHTAVYFAASHFERTSVRGRFGKIDGRISYDETSGSGAVDFTVDADSVDSGNRTLDGILRSAQFLDAQNFPVVRLRANRFVQDGGRLVAVEGELSLHGVTQPLRLEAERFSCGDISLFGIKRHVCGGDFRAVLSRSAFGMTRFLPDVSDSVVLTISVEAMPAASASK